MMAIAASSSTKAITVRGPGVFSAGRGVVATTTPCPGRAGGGASGGTGSMAAAMLQGRDAIAGWSRPGPLRPPSAIPGSAFIRWPR